MAEGTAELQESEEKFRSISASAQDAIIIIDNKGKIVYWNEAAERTFGYSKEETIGKNLCELVIPDRFCETYLKGIERFQDTGDGPSVGKVIELSALKKDGTEFSTELSLSVVNLNGIWNAIVILRNITERKRAEEALRESEEKYRKLIETAGDAIVIEDAETGIVLDVNKRAEELIGLPSKQIIGMHQTQLHPEEEAERYKNGFEEVVRKGQKTSTTDVFIRHVDGRKIPVELSSSVVLLGGKKVVQGIFRDVTERKRSETQIIRQSAILNAINKVFREAITCENEEKVGYTCLAVAEELTGSKFGFIGELNPHTGLFDTIALSDSGWEACRMPRSNAARLVKDMKIRGVDQSTIREGKSRIVDHPASHHDHVGTPKGHPPITSFLGVPLKRGDKTVGMIGLANKESGYDLYDQQAVEALSVAFVEALMRKRAEDATKHSVGKLREAVEGTVRALAATIGTRDSYTAGHQRRVADLTHAIATEMGLSCKRIKGVHLAGIIHDIGKMSVPAEILSKPGKITETEYGLIRIHPQVGYDILKGIEFPWPIAQMVLQHQERMNGSGYPSGLRGKEIILEARILAVADVVEAMSSHRPYRPALGIDKALEETSKNKGILYDADVVDACVRLFMEKRFEFK